MTETDNISHATKGPPSVAGWLGGLGALPFVALALSAGFMEETLRAQGAIALTAYGAVILSFLGGIQWGLAIAVDDGSLRRLGVSVVPSLIAWIALLLPSSLGQFLMAGSFACVLMVDLRASKTGEAPVWYPTLRWPLTIVVIASLVLGAMLF